MRRTASSEREMRSRALSLTSDSRSRFAACTTARQFLRACARVARGEGDVSAVFMAWSIRASAPPARGTSAERASTPRQSAFQMPLRDLEEGARSGRDATAAGVHRIEGPCRRRVRIEQLDELMRRKPLDDGHSWNASNAEPSRRGVDRERNAVDDEPSAHRDLHGATARTERPALSWRVRREEDALVPAEVAGAHGRSTVAQVLAARKATELCTPQLMRHDGGVLQRP